MADDLVIRSHRGPYRVIFATVGVALARFGADEIGRAHVLIDERVAKLHEARLSPLLRAASVLRIHAMEDSKSLDRLPAYVEHLVAHGVRRDHVLVAIGGGIIQDITCFLAATLLRGVPWKFLPTTLLAQADSCVGSKSSINSGQAKNILGTFTPPVEVVIDADFLDTLDERDIRSGIGEILKVHAIEAVSAFDALATDYELLLRDRTVLTRYMRRALEIKKPYVEEDEFDRGKRLIFNYGHSFGHAIEAATHFAVPHGIAVTIGMDMANYVAAALGKAAEAHAARMHPVLRKNFNGYESQPVPFEPFMAALSKDKKNVGQGSVTLILPNQEGRLEKGSHPVDERFRSACWRYLEESRRA